jgi:predicted anti-sigma-YlaC factor YlaD
MNCEQVKMVIPRYLAGESQESEAVAIEEHLAGCDHCAADFIASVESSSITFLKAFNLNPLFQEPTRQPDESPNAVRASADLSPRTERESGGASRNLVV